MVVLTNIRIDIFENELVLKKKRRVNIWPSKYT